MHLVEVSLDQLLEVFSKQVVLCTPALGIIADLDPREPFLLAFLQGFEHLQLRSKESIRVHADRHRWGSRLELAHTFIVDFDAPKELIFVWRFFKLEA